MFLSKEKLWKLTSFPNVILFLVDDFYIIAQETMNIGNSADSQARSLRSLIRNISSGGSPVLGRKESLDRGKKRSGSAGSRSWNLH